MDGVKIFLAHFGVFATKDFNSIATTTTVQVCTGYVKTSKDSEPSSFQNYTTDYHISLIIL